MPYLGGAKSQKYIQLVWISKLYKENTSCKTYPLTENKTIANLFLYLNKSPKNAVWNVKNAFYGLMINQAIGPIEHRPTDKQRWLLCNILW